MYAVCVTSCKYSFIYTDGSDAVKGPSVKSETFNRQLWKERDRYVFRLTIRTLYSVTHSSSRVLSHSSRQLTKYSLYVWCAGRSRRMCSAWKLLPLHVVCMRLSRRCPSLRRCFRLRCGFRTFIVSLAALYFAAMYLFQSGLDEPSARDREPARRWDAGGADDDFPRRRQERKEHRGQRLPVDLEGDRQAVFDGIRRLDQQRERGGRREEAADHVTGRRRPNPASDINVPASCNASASEQRRPRYDVFLPLAGLYLLSAFWDERPNDFDNWHNGTLVRVMAIIHDRPGATRLSCDFGGARRTAISFYEMCENHHRPYGSWILSCRVPDDVATQPSPCFVTVVAESSIAGDKVDVPVRTLRPPTAVPRSFSVCVPPLFGGVPPAKLVEFFEVSSTLCGEILRSAKGV